MSKVDILLPFWGDVKLFERAVESVLKQSENDWSLVVLDDHYPSTVPAQYIKKLGDERIQYFRNKQNLGITKNFNLCIERAKSNHCIIMGCDDILLPNYLETALGNIGGADIYQPVVSVIDADGNTYLPLTDRVKSILRPKQAGLYGGEKLAISLSRGNWLYFPSLMWKTETLKKYKFNDNFKIVQDVILEMQVIVDGGLMYVDTGQPTFCYRRFSESLSSKEKGKNGTRFLEENLAYSYLSDVFKNKKWNKAAKISSRRTLSKINEFLSKL